MEERIPLVIQIPDGWSLVDKTDLIHIGDRFMDSKRMEWLPTSIKPGIPVPPTPYIRKNS